MLQIPVPYRTHRASENLSFALRLAFDTMRRKLSASLLINFVMAATVVGLAAWFRIGMMENGGLLLERGFLLIQTPILWIFSIRLVHSHIQKSQAFHDMPIRGVVPIFLLQVILMTMIGFTAFFGFLFFFLPGLVLFVLLYPSLSLIFFKENGIFASYKKSYKWMTSRTGSMRSHLFPGGNFWHYCAINILWSLTILFFSQTLEFVLKLSLDNQTLATLSGGLLVVALVFARGLLATLSFVCMWYINFLMLAEHRLFGTHSICPPLPLPTQKSQEF